MPILPEKPSMDEAENELIRAGYCRLSETNKKLITGETEALLFAQEAQDRQTELDKQA
jgi:hypothetical protein